jgi:hypothetical protein
VVFGLSLRPGINVLLVKIANDGTGWKGSFEFTNPNGEPVGNLETTLDPDRSQTQ